MRFHHFFFCVLLLGAAAIHAFPSLPDFSNDPAAAAELANEFSHVYSSSNQHLDDDLLKNIEQASKEPVNDETAAAAMELSAASQSPKEDLAKPFMPSDPSQPQFALSHEQFFTEGESLDAEGDARIAELTKQLESMQQQMENISREKNDLESTLDNAAQNMNFDMGSNINALELESEVDMDAPFHAVQVMEAHTTTEHDDDTQPQHSFLQVQQDPSPFQPSSLADALARSNEISIPIIAAHPTPAPLSPGSTLSNVAYIRNLFSHIDSRFGSSLPDSQSPKEVFAVEYEDFLNQEKAAQQQEKAAQVDEIDRLF